MSEGKDYEKPELIVLFDHSEQVRGDCTSGSTPGVGMNCDEGVTAEGDCQKGTTAGFCKAGTTG